MKCGFTKHCSFNLFIILVTYKVSSKVKPKHYKDLAADVDDIKCADGKCDNEDVDTEFQCGFYHAFEQCVAKQALEALNTVSRIRGRCQDLIQVHDI